MALLREATVYSDFTTDSPRAKHFWAAMEMMSNAERAQFLRFVWGRSRLPLTLEDFDQKFKLQAITCENPDQSFPIAHTCFFTLDLPDYSSAEVACKKLVYAAFNTSSIDGDGTGTATASQQLGFGFES